MSEWQPIETAPKVMGQTILVWDSLAGYFLARWDAYDKECEPGWFDHGEDLLLDRQYFRATHWMPLPEPPK